MVTNFLTSYVEWLVSLTKGSGNDQIALKKVFLQCISMHSHVLPPEFYGLYVAERVCCCLSLKERGHGLSLSPLLPLGYAIVDHGLLNVLDFRHRPTSRVKPGNHFILA